LILPVLVEVQSRNGAEVYPNAPGSATVPDADAKDRPEVQRPTVADHEEARKERGIQKRAKGSMVAAEAWGHRGSGPVPFQASWLPDSRLSLKPRAEDH
jgi:hypothetical protein